ncbi:MAG: choice-of-anchor U domain-containing protein, partial [Gallionella sp.]|nr:choice-of-anchor U domain-containing protein [Gallionella sp.]
CATGSSSAVVGSGPWTWSCYGSDGGSNASCSTPLALLNQTVSFGAAPSITVGGTGTATATATSGLAVSFTSNTTGICTVSGSTVTGVAAGTCTVAADQAGNASYNPAPQATQNITVGKNSQTISFGAAPGITVGDTGTASATATSGLAVGFTSTTTGICTVSGSTVTGVAAGTCTIAANQAGSASYNPAPQVTQAITVTQAPVNGACGSANGIATAFAPSANLCAAGTASAVTAGSPWAWTCNGSGTNASCSAPNQPTSGGGSGRAIVSGGTWVADPALSSGFIAASGDPSGKSPPNLSPGYTFTYGLFDFTLNAGAAGTAATITITYPTALPAGAVYWKYGPSPAGYNCSGGACAAPHWYQMPAAQAVFAGDTVTLTIFDGGVGDDDLAANGAIVDQGGPGVPSVPGSSERVSRRCPNGRCWRWPG